MEENSRRSHGLGARSHKFRAHSERIQSGNRSDTDQIQSGGVWRTLGAPTGLERDLKSSERTPSRYRADTEWRCVEEDSRRSHWLGARSQKFRAHSERIQSGYRAGTECLKSAGRRRQWLGASKSSEIIYKMEFSTYEER